MVTGRTVSRTIRDWVVVRRRCRIQDHQRLQTSTLATHSNDNPDVPTPQSVCWRLQLGRQHVNWGYNIPWRWEPGFLGNIQQPWTVVQPKGNSWLLLSATERRHQPRPGLPEFQSGQPSAGQTCSRKVPAVTTSALSHDATKIQGSCPQRSGEALELSQGWLEALLTSHRLIHWTQQILRGHTRILARVYFPRPNNVSHVAAGRTMCHAGIKSVRPSIAPFSGVARLSATRGRP